VRSKVIAIKPQPYIEAARSIGAQSGRMLSRHVFPNLLSSLVVLAALEMGSVLMLLAELGFLNIFLGGFRVEIGEAGRMQPIVYYFSDIPDG
jgi:ABC-type dipeptide/oligopeptide/nickel transport system permease subunit